MAKDADPLSAGGPRGENPQEKGTPEEEGQGKLQKVDNLRVFLPLFCVPRNYTPDRAAAPFAWNAPQEPRILRISATFAKENALILNAPKARIATSRIAQSNAPHAMTWKTMGTTFSHPPISTT